MMPWDVQGQAADRKIMNHTAVNRSSTSENEKATLSIRNNSIAQVGHTHNRKYDHTDPKFN